MTGPNNHRKKRQSDHHNGKPSFNKKPRLSTNPLQWPECSKDDVLLHDINHLLANSTLDDTTTVENIHLSTELDVKINALSSTGNGLAFHPPSKSVLVVPFAVPGDTVTVRPFRHLEKQSYYLADFVGVTDPSTQRDDARIKCPYFSKCSGCQFQMLSYEDQLAHKKSIVEKAFQNFSHLPSTSIPTVRDTMGSPLQYGYRTKLTPHFDGPPGGRRARRNGEAPEWEAVPPIGFMLQGTRKTLDIEDCPIGTEAVRRGMRRERERVAKTIDTYRKGATLLLREDTKRVSKTMDSERDMTLLHNSNKPEDPVVEDVGRYYHLKSCTTDSNATSREFIDDYQFTNPAGAFFQNNNSILSPFIQYIRDQISLPTPPGDKPLSYLVDAYCGSGLFTITLSSQFQKSIGIDISPSSIEFASKNAKISNLSPSQASFLAADATEIFKKIEFPADETVIVIDPPRKGCDRPFLSQLLKFGPAKIVYVSCNVHTQARDVGCLVNGLEGVDGGRGEGQGVYELESLRGFDFFPQTGHVEGVAILRKKKD